MELLIVAFVAGILTVLAPCILPLIPVILGGGLQATDAESKPSLRRPLVVIASLAGSIIIFTLLLKSSTTLLGVPTIVWNSLAGGILVLFGINTLFPALWESVMTRTGLQARASQLLGKTTTGSQMRRDIVLGAALGPVFNSCSPTYLLIAAVILPASFGEGLVYLAAYVFGLSAILFLLVVFGRALVTRLRWMSNPTGWFQRLIGVVFVVVGVLIIIGADKQIQSFVLERGWYDPIMRIEKVFE